MGLGAILNHDAAQGWELMLEVPGTYQCGLTPSDERAPTNLEVVSAEVVLKRATAGEGATPSSIRLPRRA